MGKGSQPNSGSSQRGGSGCGKASSGGGGSGGGGKSSVSHSLPAKGNNNNNNGGRHSHNSTNARSTFPSPNTPGYGQWTTGNTQNVKGQVRSEGIREANYWAMSQKTGISTQELRDNVKSSAGKGAGTGSGGKK